MIKVAQTLEDTVKQIEEFLISESLELNDDMRVLAASMLQHEQAVSDEFDPKALGMAIRRLIFNQHLFNFMQNIKIARKEVADKAAKEMETTINDSQQEIPEVAKAVV